MYLKQAVAVFISAVIMFIAVLMHVVGGWEYLIRQSRSDAVENVKVQVYPLLIRDWFERDFDFEVQVKKAVKSILASEVFCDNMVDDDGDMRIDCEDYDCIADPLCGYTF